MRILLIALLVVGCGGGGGKDNESCATSAECSTAMPYCSAESCAATCTADTECPGFGQDPAQQFCEGGACVTCRQNMADCSGTSPVCDMGSCRACTRNDECTSGVCATDGSCVPESSIIYVSPTGSPTATCTRADQCSLTRGVQLTPPRQFIVLATGTHTLPGMLTVEGTRTLIGSGTTRPVITITPTGPMFTFAANAAVTFEHLEFKGARSATGGFDGNAIEIPTDINNMGQNVFVRVRDSVFTQNNGGISGRKCIIEVTGSTFNANGRAIAIVDSKGTVERSLFTGNTTALFLDAGIFVIRNNMIFRNDQGVDLFANDGTVIEFNTIVDNKSGLSCQAFDNPLQFPNNLLARNTNNTPNLSMCAFTNSIVTGADITPLKFKSPDTAPFDYHIQAGSSAADLASASQTMVDFDGEARPAGAANDVGADELH